MTPSSVPQGNTVEQENDDGRVVLLQYTFDYFHYAGIHRTVHLYTTPTTYIKELNIESSVDSDGRGQVNFKISTSNNALTNYLTANIYDRDMKIVATEAVNGSMIGEAIIDRVNKWWPYLMNPDPGFLYKMEVRLSTQTQENIDIYRTKFGVRTLKWTDKMFLINDKPVYFRGLGRHEDSDVSISLPLLWAELHLFESRICYYRFVVRDWIWLF